MYKKKNKFKYIFLKILINLLECKRDGFNIILDTHHLFMNAINKIFMILFKYFYDLNYSNLQWVLTICDKLFNEKSSDKYKKKSDKQKKKINLLKSELNDLTDKNVEYCNQTEKSIIKMKKRHEEETNTLNSIIMELQHSLDNQSPGFGNISIFCDDLLM